MLLQAGHVASPPSTWARPSCRRGPSEWVEAGLEQAELVAFGIGEDVPGLLAGLADVGRARPELQEAFEFGVEAFAMFEASTFMRCARTSSAAP